MQCSNLTYFRVRESERREEQSRRQAEALRKMQESQQQQAQRTSKVPPWGQNVITPAVTGPNLSLAEIQRIEREKKAQEAALLQQQRAIMAAKELQVRIFLYSAIVC